MSGSDRSELSGSERYYGLGEAARMCGVRPYVITNLFYHGHLDEARTVFVANRRLIPASYVLEIKRVLAERGYLSGRRGGRVAEVAKKVAG